MSSGFWGFGLCSFWGFGFFGYFGCFGCLGWYLFLTVHFFFKIRGRIEGLTNHLTLNTKHFRTALSSMWFQRDYLYGLIYFTLLFHKFLIIQIIFTLYILVPFWTHHLWGNKQWVQKNNRSLGYYFYLVVSNFGQ